MRNYVLPAMLFVLALTALIVSEASAGPYTFNIPNLIGVNSLDLGMTFSSINSVGVNCTGNCHFGMYLDWYGDLQDFYPEIVAQIWDEGTYSEGTRLIGTEGSFTNRLITMPASCHSKLMDGKCSVYLDYDSVAFDDVYSVSSYASVTYSSAQLIIDGTAVPEPTSAVALIGGLAGLMMRRMKRRPTA